MFKKVCMAAVIAGALGAPAFAQGVADAVAKPNATQATAVSSEAQVLERFKERFGNMPVGNVRKLPYGLYEIQLGNSLLYTDELVQFVMDGHLIDAATRTDLTEERLEQLSRVNFDALPFDLAIKQVRGDGSRRVAIFEDPNCGFCKQLRTTMEGIDNLTVYTFLFPILSPDSTQKVRDVWCAKDPGKVWDDWMLRNQVPPTAECNAPITEMLNAGRQLMVQGTPAVFFEDGTRVPGAMTKEQFLARLAGSSSK